ncbi:MAG: hypothetical protein LBL75_01025 [Rickettsiales bacterium]|jgi:hypothetical protein|nr:hypothetical protein [Rickettsiales bacterium]
MGHTDASKMFFSTGESKQKSLNELNELFDSRLSGVLSFFPEGYANLTSTEKQKIIDKKKAIASVMTSESKMKWCESIMFIDTEVHSILLRKITDENYKQRRYNNIIESEFYDKAAREDMCAAILGTSTDIEFIKKNFPIDYNHPSFIPALTQIVKLMKSDVFAKEKLEKRPENLDADILLKIIKVINDVAYLMIFRNNVAIGHEQVSATGQDYYNLIGDIITNVNKMYAKLSKPEQNKVAEAFNAWADMQEQKKKNNQKVSSENANKK